MCTLDCSHSGIHCQTNTHFIPNVINQRQLYHLGRAWQSKQKVRICYRRPLQLNQVKISSERLTKRKKAHSPDTIVPFIPCTSFWSCASHRFLLVCIALSIANGMNAVDTLPRLPRTHINHFHSIEVCNRGVNVSQWVKKIPSMSVKSYYRQQD